MDHVQKVKAKKSTQSLYAWIRECLGFLEKFRQSTHWAARGWNELLPQEELPSFRRRVVRLPQQQTTSPWVMIVICQSIRNRTQKWLWNGHAGSGDVLISHYMWILSHSSFFKKSLMRLACGWVFIMKVVIELGSHCVFKNSYNIFHAQVPWSWWNKTMWYPGMLEVMFMGISSVFYNTTMESFSEEVALVFQM